MIAKSVILLFAFLLPFYQIAGAQSRDEMMAFLRRHRSTVSAGATDSFSFDTSFYAHQYFFFGETHGSAQPQQTDWALFTQLHRRAGVRYYIAEVDFSKARLLNEYLSGGDTALLNKVFASWRRDTAQWANREHYEKWVRLRQWQRTLSRQQQITVLGVDVPQDNALLHEHFVALTRNRKFGAWSQAIDSLHRLSARPDRKELVAYAKRLLPVLDSNRSFFERTLKGAFPAFRHLIASLTFLGAGNSRDKVMYLNLMIQLSGMSLQREKMYGFLGFYHCLQTSYNQSMPFAALLKQGLAPSASMVSLVMLALDSKTMLPFVGVLRQMMPQAQVEKLWREHPGFPASGRYVPYVLSAEDALMRVAGMDILRELSEPGSVTLFGLEGSNSPFRSSRQFAEVGGFQSLQMTAADGHTLDGFQYILLFRNSRAATPFE